MKRLADLPADARLLTTHDVEKEYGITVATQATRRMRGNLPYLKVGTRGIRYEREAFAHWYRDNFALRTAVGKPVGKDAVVDRINAVDLCVLPLLTFARAVMFTGKSKSALGRAIVAGKLRVAGRCGGDGGERVFRREDLEAWMLGGEPRVPTHKLGVRSELRSRILAALRARNGWMTLAEVSVALQVDDPLSRNSIAASLRRAMKDGEVKRTGRRMSRRYRIVRADEPIETTG